MAVFLRKLLGIGKLPDELRAEVEAKLAGRTIDLRWDAPQAGAVKAEFSETGLLLEVNVAEVDQRCTGNLSLHYKEAIPEDVLMRLPRKSLAFDVPPEYVFRAVGVPYHP
jgi:hypothetical protein